MASRSVPNDFNAYVENPLRALFYTSIFCIGIGILVSILTGGDFFANLLVSFCIGWSINLSFILLGNISQRWLSPYIAPIPITAFGLSVGIIIAGLVIFGEPWFFFTTSNGTLALGVFFGILGFIIFGTRARMLSAESQLAHATAERERQEKLLTQTELKLLQAQIEPHFLFNTLSNIAGLIHQDPDAAEQTLLHLTTLLRASLRRTREEATTLAEELEIARAYLEIQSTRMRGRLSYAVASDPSLDACLLPPLLVQPLIENAIKHGIDPCEEGGHVQVDIHTNDQNLIITVLDTGVGIMPNQPTAGTGTGLKNVKERLTALYGKTASLTLTDNQPQGMLATIQIPLET